jgi:hypothetical protein
MLKIVLHYTQTLVKKIAFYGSFTWYFSDILLSYDTGEETGLQWG